MDFTDVLFIDDVAKVALEAKKFDIPFIGVPSSHEWGFQKQLMQKAGVKYMVSSIEEITEDYLRLVDEDINLWGEK